MICKHSEDSDQPVQLLSDQILLNEPETNH